MKHLVTLSLCLLVTGCAGVAGFMEKLSQPPTWPYDKIPVYPNQILDVPQRELVNYRCVKGMLYCDTRVTQSTCYCVDQQLF